jgi:hypothetical protein
MAALRDQQIAACICSECPSHPVRLITTKELPVSLLEAYRVNPLKLHDSYSPDQNLAIDRWSEMNWRLRCWRLFLEEKLEPEGRFLKSIKQGAKAKGWVRSETKYWAQDRIDQATGES